MNKLILIHPELAVSDSPRPADLRELAEEGYCTVVRITEPNQEKDPVSTEEEQTVCHSLGMSTCQFTRESLQDISGVDRFRRELATHPKPVLVHSPTGETAAAFALMDHGAGVGWDADQTLAFAQELGIPLEDPALVSLVTRYIDGHIRCGARAVVRGARPPADPAQE